MPRATPARVFLAAALTVAVAASSALAGGPGGTVTVESTIKMRETFPAFHGKVKADNANCVEQRTVKLFKQKRNGGKKKLGTDTTDNKGKWEVIVDPLKSGAYYSVVKKVAQGTAGTIYKCTRDKSQVAVVD